VAQQTLGQNLPSIAATIEYCLHEDFWFLDPIQDPARGLQAPDTWLHPVPPVQARHVHGPGSDEVCPLVSRIRW